MQGELNETFPSAVDTQEGSIDLKKYFVEPWTTQSVKHFIQPSEYYPLCKS